MKNVDYRKVLDLAIRLYGLESKQALEASRLLDKQVLREQLAYNVLKEKGYITIMINDFKNEKIIRLV